MEAGEGGRRRQEKDKENVCDTCVQEETEWSERVENHLAVWLRNVPVWLTEDRFYHEIGYGSVLCLGVATVFALSPVSFN